MRIQSTEKVMKTILAIALTAGFVGFGLVSSATAAFVAGGPTPSGGTPSRGSGSEHTESVGKNCSIVVRTKKNAHGNMVLVNKCHHLNN